MRHIRNLRRLNHLWLLVTLAACAGSPTVTTRPTADVIAQTGDVDWRPLQQRNLVYMMLDSGPVVLELSSTFAPLHAENVRHLVAAHYFDHLAIMRVQENYVVQWGDPTGTRPVPAPAITKTEYTRQLDDLSWTGLGDGDVYAPEVGWITDVPAGRSGTSVWPLHCYSQVGVGRDMPPDTGNGAELYVVSGHAPRHLDRNLAIVGRIVWGMERLTSLPRGTEAMGFYAAIAPKPELLSVRMGDELPPERQLQLEMLRTDTATWRAYLRSRSFRTEPFFVESTGHVEICNALPPVREHKR